MRRRHFHPCADCKAKMPCGAEVVRNHDGWPEALCTVEMDMRPGDEHVCEDCHEERVRREAAEEAADRAAEEAEEASDGLDT